VEFFRARLHRALSFLSPAAETHFMDSGRAKKGKQKELDEEGRRQFKISQLRSFSRRKKFFFFPSAREHIGYQFFRTVEIISSTSANAVSRCTEVHDTLRAIIGAPRIYLFKYLRINKHPAGDRITRVTRILHIAALRSRTIQRIS